jgi:hypothetical protein
VVHELPTRVADVVGVDADRCLVTFSVLVYEVGGVLQSPCLGWAHIRQSDPRLTTVHYLETPLQSIGGLRFKVLSTMNTYFLLIFIYMISFINNIYNIMKKKKIKIVKINN